MTVFDLKVGETAEIAHIRIDGGARERLSALGIIEGAEIEVLGYSLFRSSVLVACSAVRVGIRRVLALKIEVKA